MIDPCDPDDPLQAHTLGSRLPPATPQRLLRDAGFTLAEIAERCGQDVGTVWGILQADGLPVAPDALVERAEAVMVDAAASGDVGAGKIVLAGRRADVYGDRPVVDARQYVINAGGTLTPEEWMARVRERRALASGTAAGSDGEGLRPAITHDPPQG